MKENAVEAAAFAANEINGQRDGSRRKALVAMVQPADLEAQRYLGRSAAAGPDASADNPCRGKMRPTAVVIVHRCAGFTHSAGEWRRMRLESPEMR